MTVSISTSHPAVARVSRSARKRTAAVVAAVAVSAVLLMPAAASATSTHCAGFGKGVSQWGITVKNGSFCSTVNGSSYYIYNVSGSFGFALNWFDWVCNPSIRVDAYNRYGQWQWARQGGQIGGCYGWAGTQWVPGIYLGSSFYGIRGGSVRVMLQSYGQGIASNWHGIGW